MPLRNSINTYQSFEILILKKSRGCDAVLGPWAKYLPNYRQHSCLLTHGYIRPMLIHQGD